MDGKTMDTRLAECELSSLVASFVGETGGGFVRSQLLDMLSACAKDEVLFEYIYLFDIDGELDRYFKSELKL